MNRINRTCETHSKNSGSFQMTQKVDYALFLLTILAQSSKRISVRAIANEHHLSFAFLQKMARPLRSAGIIKAARGKAGGYELAKKANSITFRDIVRAVEGESAPSSCLALGLKHSACPRKALCTIRPALKKIHQQMQELYLSKPLTYFFHKQ